MFITATFIINAANPKATSQPDHSKNPKNFIADEVVSITKKIRDSDLKKCNVILDVKNKEVLKCRNFQMGGQQVTNPNYQMLLEHFQAMYPNEVGQLLQIENLNTTA
jgi:hypothetical protein